MRNQPGDDTLISDKGTPPKSLAAPITIARPGLRIAEAMIEAAFTEIRETPQAKNPNPMRGHRRGTVNAFAEIPTNDTRLKNWAMKGAEPTWTAKDRGTNDARNAAKRARTR